MGFKSRFKARFGALLLSAGFLCAGTSAYQVKTESLNLVMVGVWVTSPEPAFEGDLFIVSMDQRYKIRGMEIGDANHFIKKYNFSPSRLIRGERNSIAISRVNYSFGERDGALHYAALLDFNSQDLVISILKEMYRSRDYPLDEMRAHLSDAERTALRMHYDATLQEMPDSERLLSKHLRNFTRVLEKMSPEEVHIRNVHATGVIAANPALVLNATPELKEVESEEPELREQRMYSARYRAVGRMGATSSKTSSRKKVVERLARGWVSLAMVDTHERPSLHTLQPSGELFVDGSAVQAVTQKLRENEINLQRAHSRTNFQRSAVNLQASNPSVNTPQSLFADNRHARLDNRLARFVVENPAPWHSSAEREQAVFLYQQQLVANRPKTYRQRLWDYIKRAYRAGRRGRR